jgi:hypothetical protein
MTGRPVSVGGQQDQPSGGHRGLPADGHILTLRNRPGEATARERRAIYRHLEGAASDGRPSVMGRIFWDSFLSWLRNPSRRCLAVARPRPPRLSSTSAGHVPAVPYVKTK